MNTEFKRRSYAVLQSPKVTGNFLSCRNPAWRFFVECGRRWKRLRLIDNFARAATLFDMPKKHIKHPDKEKSTGAYSAGVEIDGWVYVSGQVPVDAKTGQPVRGTIEEDTKLTLQHIEKILQAAGCSLHDVVKCTVHLADIENFDRYNSAYRDFFKEVEVLPARTTVQSVLSKHIQVEIDCVARKPG